MFELMDAYSQSAVIKVLGIGGGGGNAVSHMVTAGIEGVDFMCINTDAQALKHSKVKTALLAEKNLKALDINVETQNGVVQLSGFAVSSAQIVQAVDVAMNVKGVKDVKNDIRLKTDTQG